ncbi:MAG: potassium transporter KefA [Betaproteobacteria bacterium HGW-Betaproteobacteria-22]|nr:MAG: potassium transporter KefA [Betaproteobacteria bacterium HGW-Betaproteobacteria-22]
MPLSSSIQSWLDHVLVATWFNIGSTPINFSRVVGLLLILFIVWWIAYSVEQLIVRLTKRNQADPVSESTIYAFSRISRYLIWLIGVILGLNFIGFDIGSLMLVGGALGVGIGFGLQNIFSNLISGIIILLERTLKVGDFVDLQSGVMGRVSEINMRYTRVTTNDAVDIIVPNSEFINGRVTNWTLSEMLRRMHIPFGVAYGTDKDAVRTAALKAAATLHFTVEDSTHNTDVWLVNMGDSSLDFELIVWVGLEGVRAPAMVHAKYLWAIETELRNANIEIPFPQRDLHLRGGSLDVNLIRE